MSWTIMDVQSSQGVGVDTLQLPAFVANPVAGDLIVVGQSNWNSTPIRALLTPTDTAGGNTYTQQGSQIGVSANINLGVWVAPVVNGGSTFRVTGNSTPTTAFLSVIAWLLRESNGAPVSNGDLKTAGPTTSTNPTSGTTTPAPAVGSLFLGFMTNTTTSAAPTDGSGWNAIANGFNSTMNTAAKLPDEASHQDLFSEYILSDSAVAANWTAVSNTWGVIALSWGPLAGGVKVYRQLHRPFTSKPSGSRLCWRN